MRELLSEEEYLNGEKNGKVKEYNSEGYSEFEGEYLSGKIWNGKGYDKDHNVTYEIKNSKGYKKDFCTKNNELSYEAEYLNAGINGIVKKYHYLNSKLKFIGEYFDGSKNGKAKEYYLDEKLKYEGEYLYNFKLRGKEFHNEKLIYEGEYFLNKRWNGKIYDENGNVIYEIKEGNGKGKEYDDNGNLIFEGEYLNGEMNQGIMKKYDTFTGKLSFEGEYSNEKKIGKEKNMIFLVEKYLLKEENI